MHTLSKKLIHLLPTWGDYSACGRRFKNANADINFVTCKHCLKIHEVYGERAEEEI